MSGDSNFFVSVVTVLSNDADIAVSFVEECASILEERYENYELVLVDDGSIDDTQAVIEGLLKQHDAIRYILLSRRFGVTLRELAEWNHLKGDTIFAGQELVVGRQKDDFQYYKVVRGDTLFSIASRFGLEVEEIARTNNMSVSSTLLTGMTLRIQSDE